MWFTCLFFGWFLQDCLALPDRVGSYLIDTNSRDAQTCKRENDFEVCAWIERFKLHRRYPKQQAAVLYRSVSLTEGRSIKSPNGETTSFTFEWSGPQEMLSPYFNATHSNQLAMMEPDLDRHNLSSSYRSNFTKEASDFFVFVEVSNGASVHNLISKATCGKHGEVRQGRFFLGQYPDLTTMLECLEVP